ncbi:MAG: motility protein A [Christensenellales bacterium]|jgi:chemotaxis protein MotA
MGLTALLGMLLGVILIFFSIVADGSPITDFYDFASVVIVFGGTFCSLLLQYPLESFAKAGRSVVKVLTYKNRDLDDLRKKIVELAYLSKKEGLLALESRVEEIGDEFLIKGIMLIIDGTNPELTKKALELEMDLLAQRDESEQAFMNTAAKYAPAFGMLGTLIGLIKMLKNLNDVSSVGPAMAVAIVTTFYGSFLANVLFIPLAGRLKYIDDLDSLRREMVTEGILSIQSGETPSIIEEKLGTYVEKSQRKKGKDKR